MDQITLTFPNPLNVSIQVGDTTYYSNDVNGADIQVMGLITAINRASNSDNWSIASASSANGSLKILNSYFP